MSQPKQLLLGNEAVARGLYEAGVRFISSYPGTPSTEITEAATQYDDIYTEWAPNEKVALEAAFGASTAGVRSFSAMKHVGLNVCADPLFTASYIGVNGGLVIAVADDPAIHSSQNEQDSRNYAIAAKLPMLEPSDSKECKEFAKLAFEISEKYDAPVMLRLSTRISHARSLVELENRVEPDMREYQKDVMKNVMMPAQARAAHIKVEDRTEAIRQYAENSGINAIEDNGSDIGVIAAGSSYTYAKEALGDRASYLKLGMINPLPVELIKDFAAKVKTLYVIEELDSIIETHCRSHGINVIGKEIFPKTGEFSQNLIKKAILGEEPEYNVFDGTIPPRPPALCAGCPHRGVFYALKGLDLYVSGDIGCYTLGANAPLSSIDTVLCMGASVSALHGFNTARGNEQAKRSVAVIGDSTFIHSGITGLIDIAYNRGMSTVIVLDNSITGMTGHQNNPMNGLTIKGDPTAAVNLEALAHAVGINRVVTVDPYDVESVRSAVKTELEAEEPSLIIARRPCALLKNVKHSPPLSVIADKCVGCKACMKVGCPALSQQKDNTGKSTAVIDGEQCLGCGICTFACRFGAIKGAEK